MNKLTLIACIVAILAIAGIFAMKTVIAKQKAEISRQKTNIDVLTSDAVRFETKSGKAAEQVQALTLKNSELATFNKQLADDVEDARIKLKDVKRTDVVEARTEMAVKVVTRVDTLRNERSFSYFDGYNSVKGVSRPDTTELSVNSIDTINVIGDVKQKKFLFIRIGKPKIRTTVTNKNPKTALFIKFSANID